MDLYQIRKDLNLGISLTNMKLRVTDYARVSTDHVEQKKSLKNQVEHFEEFIKKNPNWTYVEGYIDEGITGTSDIKRENFMKMIEDAKLGLFDLIITKEISRFSRNTLDSIKYTRELLSYGVAVLFMNDNINTALPDSELRLTIMASMAQDEIRRLSGRVKFGMNRAIERGEILGNNSLYGYKKDKATGNLIVILEEAEIIRFIYEKYGIEKISLSKLTKLLKERIPEKKWSVTGLTRTIENPKYKGYYCARKSEVTDFMTKKIKYFSKKDWVLYENKTKIPPIISENLWEKANKRLQRRKKMKNKKKREIFDTYIYSSKIICAKDQTSFHRRIFRKGIGEPSWLCQEYLKKGKKICDSPNIRETELNQIWDYIMKKLQIFSSTIKDILLPFYKKEESIINKREKIKNLEKEQETIYKKKDKLLELTLQNYLVKEEFEKKNNALNKKIEEITKKLEEIKKIEKKEQKNKIEYDLLDKIKQQETKNKIIRLLLNHIIAEKKEDIIHLTIFLNSKKKINDKKNFVFKRGYDCTGTKRYTINYEVKICSLGENKSK